MTSALYLENYLDGLEHLPAELRRNFYLMRELDNRVQTLMKTIDKECNDFMGNISADSSTPSTEDGRKDKLKAIQDMFNKTKQLGDDKVGLSSKAHLDVQIPFRLVGTIGHSDVRTGGQTHQKTGRGSAAIRGRDPREEPNWATGGKRCQE